ncbi:MAG: nucleotide exchange factor GrpE, partial [Bacteroidales bacterium]|nr:nucleotide exchange factor GrpE [Bacteroidales bacterium]
MSKHKNKNRPGRFAQEEQEEKTAAQSPENEETAKAETPEKEAEEPASKAEETPGDLLAKEKEKVEEEKRKYVYLMAEFDNYRRRVS